MTIEELKVVIKAETDGLRKEIDLAKKKLNKFDDDTKTITNSIKKAFAGISIAYIGKQFADLGMKAIQTASDLEEVQNVVDVSFGEMAKDCEEFAKTAKTSFGMSELSAKQTASTFMSMATSMGLSNAQASNMSLTMTGLAGDMSSFYNVSQSVANTALKSVWTGETESLKQFGVVMTQANLQQFAMSRGMSKNIADMTQAEQVTLRYNYVLSTLKNVQGDFIRTSDSWANQTRLLSENWKELLGVLGQQAMTSLTPLLTKLVEFSSWATNNATVIVAMFQQIISGVTGIGIAFLTAKISTLASEAIVSFGKLQIAGGSLFKAFSTGYASLNWVAISLGAIAYASMTVIQNLGNMSSIQTAISIFNGLAVAIGACAVAYALFQAISLPAVGTAIVLGAIATAGTVQAFVNSNNAQEAEVSSWEDSLQPAFNEKGKPINYDVGAYATGGVITKPTLGLMGEYSGAKNNPEIVTPQNLMYETTQKAINEAMQNSQQSDTQEFILPINIKLDGQTIYKNQEKVKRERGYNFEGMGVFAR